MNYRVMEVFVGEPLASPGGKVPELPFSSLRFFLVLFKFILVLFLVLYFFLVFILVLQVLSGLQRS